MAGLGLLLGGIAGAGRGLAQSAAEDQRVLDEQRLAQQRAQLEEEKTARIDEARAARQRQAGVQQGQDIQAETQRLQNQSDAAAINAKYGSNATAEDVQALRGNEAARQAYGLLSPTRQSDLEARATAAENLGYLDAAKETRSQLQTEVSNKRQEASDTNTNRRLDLQEQRQKQIDDYNQRREDRLDRLAAAQLSFQQARAGKEDARSEQMAEREQRAATANALRGAESDIKQLSKDIADPLLAPEQKQVIQRQLDSARTEARRYRSALSGAGLEGSEAPSKPFNPDDFRTGVGGSSGGSSRATTVPNPLGQGAAPAPAERASPGQQAVRALDIAINNTVRDLTAANNRGDQAEVARLNDLLQQQQAAKSRAL